MNFHEIFFLFSSPDSIYDSTPSNYSPKEEDQRPTPSSSRSSHDATEGPMDFSKANRYDQKKFRERFVIFYN